MVLPGGCAPLATGGVLGALFCLLWRWIRLSAREARPLQRVGLDDGNEPRGPRTNPDSTVSMAWPLGLMLLGALAPLLLCGTARGVAPSMKAAKPGESRAAAGQPEFAVLAPIDAQRKPVGGKLYVPEPLYQELLRRAAAAEKPTAWMIVGATYRGGLLREAASGRLTPGTLRAEYDLRVFQRAARVQLPFDAAAAGLLPGSLLLDGQPVGPESEKGDSTDFGAKSAPSPFSFVVAEPGQHRLELLLRPAISGGGAAGGFDLSIPRVPAARLELTLPDDAPVLEVPSAHGAVEIAPARGASQGRGPMPSPAIRSGAQLMAELGPADRLTVRWRKATAPGVAPAAVEAEQLLWLRVQPGSVVIAAKFKLRLAEGQVERVQLAVDPRLRLLPLGGDDPPAVQFGPETGPSRQIIFRWPRPIPGETTLEATFLLSGASGVGNLCLPQIELLDARVARRWLAVSVDPALDHQQQQLQGLEAASAADFLKAWNGERSQIPQAAYRLPAGPVAWSLSTRPHEPHSAIDQTLSLSFDADHVDLAFDGQLSVTAGYVFQHRLTAPRGLKIERVSVLEKDVERALRWAQDDDGAITVFLSGPASGLQKLTIRGQLPLQSSHKAATGGRAGESASDVRTPQQPQVLADGATTGRGFVSGAPCLGEKWPLPVVRVEKCDLRSATIRLFRRPAVLLTIDGPPRSRLPIFSTDSDLGRLVATIPWDGSSQPPVTVTVKPDQLKAPTTAGVAKLEIAATARGPASSPFSRPDRDPLSPRLAAGAALLLLAVLAIVGMKRGWLTALSGRPHAVGVLLGLAWWLWLSPSILGLLIGLASVLWAAKGRAT
jgi:hypothetical protein